MCDDLSSPTPSDDPPQTDDASGLTNDELWDAVRTQASHLAAGEARFLYLLGIFDEREAWGAWGILSPAHWLNWSVGTSLGTAREQVRVARALRRLPQVAAAFGAGQISYSKVRAITRVANPVLEAPLLELAREMTASQLERTVSYYRRADPEEGRAALRRRDGRYFRSTTDEEGMVRISARYSPEDAAVVLAAIEVARRALAEDEYRTRKGSGVSAEMPGDASAPGPDDDSAETSGNTNVSGPSDVSAETSEDPWWEEWDTYEDYDTGAEPGAAADTDVSAEKPTGLPCEGPGDDWEHTRADALVAVCRQILSKGMAEDPGPPAVRVMVHVDEAVLDDPAKEGCSHIEGLGSIAAHTAARLACEGALSRVRFRPGRSVESEGATRQIPDTIRRAVLARDRGCRFPGCERRAFLHLHHVRFVSQGGPTRASNLAAICSAHHRLIHEGGFRLSMSPEGAVRVWSPGGTEIRPAELPRTSDGLDLCAANARWGLAIDHKTLSYNGERCDYDHTITALLCISGNIDYKPGKEEQGPEEGSATGEDDRQEDGSR